MPEYVKLLFGGFKHGHKFFDTRPSVSVAEATCPPLESR